METKSDVPVQPRNVIQNPQGQYENNAQAALHEGGVISSVQEVEAELVQQLDEEDYDEDVTADSFCNVPPEEEPDCNKSAFASLYKVKPSNISQERRREKLLQSRRLRRNEMVDKSRGLLELYNANEIEMADLTEVEQMDVDVKRKRRNRRKNRFRLMLSEWMTETPTDLEENWVIKFCPVGKRSLVLAYGQFTKTYSRRGYFKSKFISMLPGGGPQSADSGFTALDCIYDQNTQCYYVLDCLVWNDEPFQYYDANYRFYLLNTLLEATPQPDGDDSTENFRFVNVSAYPTESTLIEEKLSNPFVINGEEVKLDGILFYHKEADYIESYTPLVGWLKPYMIPERLGLSVNDCYMQGQPENYSTLANYIKATHLYKLRQQKGNCSMTSQDKTTEEVNKKTDMRPVSRAI